MCVYVDDMRAAFGRMTMCHMIADTRAELLAMAARIAVPAHWLQDRGTYKEHFDICLSKRKMAVQAGARPLTRKQLGAMLLNRRRQLHHAPPA